MYSEPRSVSTCGYSVTSSPIVDTCSKTGVFVFCSSSGCSVYALGHDTTNSLNSHNSNYCTDFHTTRKAERKRPEKKSLVKEGFGFRQKWTVNWPAADPWRSPFVSFLNAYDTLIARLHRCCPFIASIAESLASKLAKLMKAKPFELPVSVSRIICRETREFEEMTGMINHMKETLRTYQTVCNQHAHTHVQTHTHARTHSPTCTHARCWK